MHGASHHLDCSTLIPGHGAVEVLGGSGGPSNDKLLTYSVLVYTVSAKKKKCEAPTSRLYNIRLDLQTSLDINSLIRK